jgi:acyl-CoA thioester hydrolase
MTTGTPFIIREYVRWSDVDYSRIIRYDAYVRFFELGEGEMFRAAGMPLRDLTRREDVTFPRRVLHQEYQSPATLDELLEVRTRVSRIGTTSITLAFEIVAASDGAPRATGHMVLVSVDPQTFTKRDVPPDVIARLQPFVVP